MLIIPLAECSLILVRVELGPYYLVFDHIYLVLLAVVYQPYTKVGLPALLPVPSPYLTFLSSLLNRVFYHFLIQVLRQQLRGGWGVKACADLADTGGGGGSKIWENLLM